MSAALIDAARAALNAWEYDSSECRWHMDNLRTALAAAEAQPVGEPVAWRPVVGAVARALDQCASNAPDGTHPATMREASAKLTSLMVATPAQPAAQPLTDEQIKRVLLDAGVRCYDASLWDAFTAAGKAIERAHGIGSQP